MTKTGQKLSRKQFDVKNQSYENNLDFFFYSRMPDCTVSDCNFLMSEKGTYQSFYLPKDEKLRSKWLHNMNRPNLMEISQNPKVSILHI